MTIILDAPAEPQFEELPGGHRRYKTHYERADTGDKHRRISGLPWPDDFAGATRYMAGKWVARNLPDLMSKPLDDVPRIVAQGAESELSAAAARGTALHKYVECRILGLTPPWEQIERDGAAPYVPAADRYLVDHPPAAESLNEIPVFGESCGVKIAGTVDHVALGEQVVVRDWKTRTTRHDRRAKEAAQLGAYAYCLLSGCYVDHRGYDRTLDRIDHAEVVTFCPDGTYAIHRVELADAFRAHQARMAFVGLGVRELFAKAVKAEAPSPAEVFQAELDAMTDEDKMALAMLWREHRMPRIAELEPHHYVTARRLFMQAGPWFDGPEPPLPPLATVEQVIELRRRLAALPADIRKTIGDV